MLRVDETDATSIAARTPTDLEQDSARELHIEALIKPSFDSQFYAREYRDIDGSADFLLRHFCRCGWKEGRNPNANFDTVAYLLLYSDVAESGINPFFHFLLRGHEEGRTALPAVIPSKIVEEVWGQDPGDWVKLMRPFVDETYYIASLNPPFDGSFDPVVHYAYRGWLNGCNPNADFDVGAILSAQPRLRDLRLNPLLLSIVKLPLLDTSLFHDVGNLVADHLVSPVSSVEITYDHVLYEVDKHLDTVYYSAMYPEIDCQYDSAAIHYCNYGWLEGKNPTSWFDTTYYLEANSDVATQRLNPFWHYLVAGMAEGRHARRPGGYRRQIIDGAVDPDEITKHYIIPKTSKILSRVQLEKQLRVSAKLRAGFVLSVGHDNYLMVTGGIQLFISDEQARFAERNMGYLNISPVRPLLRLADPGDSSRMVNLILDGNSIGSATYDTLVEVLRRLPPRPGEQRLLLIHSLLGHAIQDIIELHRVSGSTADFFWVHDYSSLCVGYTLLRNDVEFCKAPPPDSMMCRVCVYSERRPYHISQLHQLFEAISFQVVAPSQAALDVWQEHTDLPYQSASVHPHCNLIFEDDPFLAGSKRATIRVAFIGYPRVHKGWPLWQEIVSRCWQRGTYQFVHLGTGEAPHPSFAIEHYRVSTSPDEPDAMVKALVEHEIDLVLILSTWPETFSYVTYEALAAGTDIVCLADSGNVADTVRLYSRGFVANDDAELFAFFETDQAMDYVALSQAKGRRKSRIIRNGTTATLIDVGPSA